MINEKDNRADFTTDLKVNLQRCFVAPRIANLVFLVESEGMQ
jgi:hypothetical protein